MVTGEVAACIIDLLEMIYINYGKHMHPRAGGLPEAGFDAFSGRTRVVEAGERIKLRFLAEPRMLSRLARNMLGSEPEKGEAQEYAMEFFNILCGRFISELYKATETTTRFFPTRYEALPNPTGLGGDTSLSTVYFISDEEELAAFSWTAEVVNDLLRRSMHVQV